MKHYAGKVKYTVDGWVERNMDRVPESFNDTLQSSTLKVIFVVVFATSLCLHVDRSVVRYNVVFSTRDFHVQTSIRG